MNGSDSEEAPIVSVCIPALNEAVRLPQLLAQLVAQRDVTLDIIVADGGSTDGSLQTLAAAVRVVMGADGRGAQMNAAARMARGEWLLFLHADTQLNDSGLLADAVSALTAAQARAGHHRIAGHFPLRFERDRARHGLLFRYMEAKTALNRPGTINGDQGMLLSRRCFDSLGGFDESRTFLEDQDFAARVFAEGQWITLPGRLTTSARRFETLGPWRVYGFMALIMAAWKSGNDVFLQQVPALYARPRADGCLDLRAAARSWLASWRAQTWPTRRRWGLSLVRYAALNLWQVMLFVETVFHTRRRAA
ncbi:MAG TPA: TIGR04283 family arsenosugar biosynthesis glycosyltransferase [Gammaproteobacteria bacterium]|nr:TIGR04283 family arsenosugar biosynthesis glycosyltransferase [Gammaproteobacteria bacterium]